MPVIGSARATEKGLIKNTHTLPRHIVTVLACQCLPDAFNHPLGIRVIVPACHAVKVRAQLGAVPARDGPRARLAQDGVHPPDRDGDPVPKVRDLFERGAPVAAVLRDRVPRRESAPRRLVARVRQPELDVVVRPQQAAEGPLVPVEASGRLWLTVLAGLDDG